MDRDLSAKGEVAGKLLCPLPEWLALLGAINAVEPDALGMTIVHHMDGITVHDTNDSSSEFLSEADARQEQETEGREV
jgi:hypothetical protein